MALFLICIAYFMLFNNEGIIPVLMKFTYYMKVLTKAFYITLCYVKMSS